MEVSVKEHKPINSQQLFKFMFPTDKKLKLVQTYFFVCEQYESNLQFLCERFSNYKNPEFTDQEAMTIYLFAMNVERRFQIKEIYCFAKDY